MKRERDEQSTQKSGNTLDVRQLAEQELSAAEFPARGKQAFRIHLDPRVHRQVQEHSLADPRVEICGVLVGKWHKDDQGPFVTITDSIRGDQAESKLAEVTFTHETWAKINKRMDAEFADKRIVGWYHTHPNFGIFLSDRDRFIHEHFFGTPGQVAYVVDPVRKEEGFFLWRDGKPTPCPHYWVGTDLRVAPSDHDKPPRSAVATATRGEPDARQPEGSNVPPRDALSWITPALMGTCLFLIGYLLASRMSDYDRARLQQGVVAAYGINNVLNTGLRQKLDQAATAVAEIEAATRQLSAEQLKPTTLPATEMRDRWDRLAGKSGEVRRYLERLRDDYALTKQEEEYLSKLILQITAAAGGQGLTFAPPTGATTLPAMNRPATRPATPTTRNAAQPAPGSGGGGD
jgi:proteasome lid subunit RPN8/RPN11